MTKEQEISNIEIKLRAIFAQDYIRSIDIKESKKLLEKWKFLTRYVPDKTPVMLQTVDDVNNILEKNPIWQRKQNYLKDR